MKEENKSVNHEWSYLTMYSVHIYDGICKIPQAATEP